MSDSKIMKLPHCGLLCKSFKVLNSNSELLYHHLPKIRENTKSILVDILSSLISGIPDTLLPNHLYILLFSLVRDFSTIYYRNQYCQRRWHKTFSSQLKCAMKLSKLQNFQNVSRSAVPFYFSKIEM